MRDQRTHGEGIFLHSGRDTHRIHDSGIYQKCKTQGDPVTQILLFRCGSCQFSAQKNRDQSGITEFGHTFEHFILQEIIAYIGYFRTMQNLSYWRTVSGYEVDAIIGNARLAIEIKSSTEVQSHHTKGLKAFSEEYPEARLIIVSMDKYPRRMNNVEIYPATEFLSMLWNGDFF